MLFKTKNGVVIIDTLSYLPVIPSKIENLEMQKDQILSHLKVNNSLTYTNEQGETLPITVFNADGTHKQKEEIYDILTGWGGTTLMNAFFARSLEAGNIGGGGKDIAKLLVKRLGPEDNYQNYRTIGEIPYSREQSRFEFRDYFIQSGKVYLYTIQPVSESNHHGALQNKSAGLNRYEYTWIIDSSGTQIEVLDAKLSSVNYHSKDGVVETIGGKKPHVNRYSNLDYRSFTLTGTIATEFDRDRHVMDEMDNKTNSEISGEVASLIEKKFLEVNGELPTHVNNSMRYYSYEKEFREKVLAIFNNGQIKIFKSPTEGLLLVKMTNINITPIEQLGRALYTFSANVTEIGEVTEETLKNFIVKER